MKSREKGPRAAWTPPSIGAGQRSRRFWELKQAAERDGVLQMYLYGIVEGGYWDWWTGEYHESDTSAEHFRQELGKYPDVKEIEIFINSDGGEVYEGTAIYSQLRRHPARKTVFVDGFACSVASVIAMAGDEVVMPRNTMMMIHDMWTHATGNAAQLRKAADDVEKINAAGRQAYLLKAGAKLTEDRLAELMRAETWLTAAECIELGLADRFADEEVDLTAAAGMLQRVNERLEQQVERQKGIAARLREMAQANGPSVTPTPSGAVPGGAAQEIQEAAVKRPTLMELLTRCSL